MGETAVECDGTSPKRTSTPGTCSENYSICPVDICTEGSGGTTLLGLLYFAFALVHVSRGIEIVNFTISLALSAGMLMASAGTPYRLVPAHFYPCLPHVWPNPKL